MNVLVIAPHPDDEAIGCGGTICAHGQRGDLTSVVFLTSGELGLKHLPRDEARAIRESEARKAARVLKLQTLFFLRCSDWTLANEIVRAARLLQPILKNLRPDLVYLPHPHDAHPDHQAAWPIVQAAFKNAHFRLPPLRFYEVWTPLSHYDFVEDISPAMARKLRALRAHQSQLLEFDYIRAVTGLNQYRGALAAKCDFAEVFSKAPRK